MSFVTVATLIVVVATVAQNVEQNKANRRYEKALQKQADQRAEENADSASAEMNERVRTMRRARASARAAASDSGVNLDSGSFLAQLQVFDQQQDMDSGLVSKNMNNANKGINAEHSAALSRISYKTGLGIALDATAAGTQAYMGAGGKTYMGSQPGKG